MRQFIKLGEDWFGIYEGTRLIFSGTFEECISFRSI